MALIVNLLVLVAQLRLAKPVSSYKSVAVAKIRGRPSLALAASVAATIQKAYLCSGGTFVYFAMS